ncbi:hypothetical protein NQ315_013989 [Exocentrus adspersus]|uniref:Uncharacterized protein n=1 Tax=Exocentrus adspersus TaxID=1586481 RepID=A0AAV8VHX0_9CUCU|nr:hypothetical protein NQ315_013989 [Exocentrus adspersus]
MHISRDISTPSLLFGYKYRQTSRSLNKSTSTTNSIRINKNGFKESKPDIAFSLKTTIPLRNLIID